jgi:hypothetical protein
MRDPCGQEGLGAGFAWNEVEGWRREAGKCQVIGMACGCHVAMILGQGHGGGVCHNVDKVVSEVVE